MNDTDFDRLAEQLALAGLTPEQNLPLAPHTTYQVGGRARLAVRIRTADEAVRLGGVVAVAGVSSVGDADGVPVLVVGRGSNLLVADSGFDGLAVLVSAMGPDEVVFDGDTVAASGGTPLPVLARRCVTAGRCGLEWAVGVPGSVGGGVRMNAGGHGADIAASLIDVDLVSLRSGVRATVGARDLDLHFRGSALADHHLVLSARFATTAGDCADALAEIVTWRRENQPGGRNAGSVFVNPAPGAGSAGAIIDALGMRGVRRGGAEVSGKHANFILADADARAADVLAVMETVHSAVLEATGVSLRSEVRLVGFDDPAVQRFGSDSHGGPEHDAARTALAATMGEL